MEPRLSLVTLGVADISGAREFYDRLGWRGQEVEDAVFFQAGSVGMVLWGRDKLTEDTGLDDASGDGVRRYRPRSQRVLARRGRRHRYRRWQRRSDRDTSSESHLRRRLRGLLHRSRSVVSGRSHATPDAPWMMMARSRSPTSALATPNGDRHRTNPIAMLGAIPRSSRVRHPGSRPATSGSSTPIGSNRATVPATCRRAVAEAPERR